MSANGFGRGVLRPTGKEAPAVKVHYEIDHHDFQSQIPGGANISRRLASVRSLIQETGRPLPLGDYDLLAGDTLIRLKHKAGKPDWLVLSNFA